MFYDLFMKVGFYVSGLPMVGALLGPLVYVLELSTFPRDKRLQTFFFSFLLVPAGISQYLCKKDAFFSRVLFVILAFISLCSAGSPVENYLAFPAAVLYALSFIFFKKMKELLLDPR